MNNFFAYKNLYNLSWDQTKGQTCEYWDHGTIIRNTPKLFSVSTSVAWSAGVASTGRTDAVKPTRDGGIFQRINIIIWKFRCGAITNAAKRCGK